MHCCLTAVHSQEAGGPPPDDQLVAAAQRVTPSWVNGQLQVELPEELGYAVKRVRLETGGVAWPAAATKQLRLQQLPGTSQVLQREAALRSENPAKAQGGQQPSDGLLHVAGASDRVCMVTGIHDVRDVLQGAQLLPCTAQFIEVHRSHDSGSEGEGEEVTPETQRHWELTIRVTWSGQQVCDCDGQPILILFVHARGCAYSKQHAWMCLRLNRVNCRAALIPAHMVCTVESKW
jgi:hypothetical protein